METDQVTRTATERVLKARAELIMARRFYGVLVSNVEPVPSRKVQTMATDSKRHFYNPDFIATLTQMQLLAVQAHESEHDARHHSTRRRGRDPEKWNEACDYAINVDLRDEGFDLPPWVLLDEKYRGMSAEDIYRSRELDQQPQPQPPQPQEGDDESDDEQSSGSDGDDADDQDAGDEADDAEGKGDQGEGDDADDQGNPGDGEGDEADDGDETSGSNADDGDEGEAGDQPGGQAGDGDEGGDEPGRGADADGEPDGEGNGPQQSNDPGRCGEVLDAADDTADLSDIDSTWDRVVRQAASIAKAVGQLPGHITREIERSNNPTQDWREVLRAWFDQGALRTETWNRPNRRFIGQGLILPGSQRDGVNKAMFLIDTSGSMDEVALRLIATEAQAALDDGVVDEVVAVYGDTRVTRVDTYRTGDEITFDPRGGGGTDLRPLFRYVAEEHDDASLIVCFTDLYIGDPGPEPHCPVLFAVTGYPEAVRSLIATAPWGAPGIDVGAH
jgi:predicted metal-dependent peptidase